MNATEILYSEELELDRDLGIDVPAWIEQDIDTSQVAAILEGGCASGAYMPAVTYHRALQTMQDHGNDVCQYIEDHCGGLPNVDGESWAGIACLFLSTAVELWASSVSEEAAEAVTERQENDLASVDADDGSEESDAERSRREDEERTYARQMAEHKRSEGEG